MELPKTTVHVPEGLSVATLAGGCFWCLEAVYEKLIGVEKVISGYAGGHRPNPTYQQIGTGVTGHAEVVQIFYNEKEISYEEILTVFWTIHDPTTPNRQGNDKGPQYRSAIFVHNELQKEIATQSMKTVATQIWEAPIVTELNEFSNFYTAEDYHQGYFERVGNQNPYCTVVVSPKVQKFKKLFKNKLKQQN